MRGSPNSSSKMEFYVATGDHHEGILQNVAIFLLPSSSCLNDWESDSFESVRVLAFLKIRIQHSTSIDSIFF